MNNNTTLVSQEPSLPANNEDVIRMLGLHLDGCYDEGSNTGKLVDDIVRNLDLSSFMTTTAQPSVEAVAAPIGFESIQGHQQIGGQPLEAYQTLETISLVDLTPVSPYSVSASPVSPYSVPGSPYNSPDRSRSSSPYYVPESSLYSTNVATPPQSPQQLLIESSSPLSPTHEVSPAVTNQSAGGGKAPRRRRDPKPKLYQREEPLSDPEEEKKRQNAINAKKNRDKQKNRLQELEAQVKSLTAERDALQNSNNKLKRKSDAFERQLRTVCQQFNVPVIILPQD